MADIRSFFSPKSFKQKSASGANQETSHDKGKNTQKKSLSSPSPGRSKTKNKTSDKDVKKKGAKRVIVIPESDDDDDDEFVRKKPKKSKKSHDSDSEEEPLPQELRRSKKKESAKPKSKKSSYFDESDDDDEAPIKVKKLSKSAEKSKKQEQKKSKSVKPVKPVKPVTPEKPVIIVTPIKRTTTVDDFFGSVPVQRSTGKTAPTKRKQISEEDDTEIPQSSKSSSFKENSEHDSHQPIKKRKEEKSPAKKSPIKEEKSTLSSKLAKVVATSKTLAPDTPTPEKTDVKTKPRKTPSPTKPVVESPKKKPDTPNTQSSQPGNLPASLEKKKSGYRSFMQREGPRALGSKEIPQGEENCFEGKTFVITGILETIEREEAQDMIQRYGGKLTAAVSKKTAYLIIGRDPGASKITKANTLGTKTINEDGFFDLIKSTPGKKSSYNDTPEKPPAKKLKTSMSESPSNKPPPKKSPKHLPCEDRAESQSSQKSTASVSSPATQTPSGSPVVKGESLMWVDKYKPQGIKQIIGQQGDKSNMRKLVNWIKNWNSNRRKTHPKTSFFQKDQDGATHKAALLSGPPGIGKTTTAVLVCKELGYSFVEMNASDSRNKKCLEEHVSQLISNKSMDAFVGGSNTTCQDASKHVLIMDEVDGMAGNEDRGGMQELISLIKSSKIPIICMCNDRNSQKIRSLVNYCFDLRFQRPRVEQIKGAMMSIAFKEGVKIPPPAMDQIIIGANQDIRQVLHNMSMWTSTNKHMTYDEAKDEAKKAHKDIKTGPFDAIRKLLSFESNRLSVIDKSDLFFCDYSLMPLFVQENYLAVRPGKAEGNIHKCLDLVSKTADSISDGDLVEKQIRSRGSWSLLPTQAIFSSVIPSYFICGGMDKRIDFPQWLGKNSKRGRLDRILQELQCHMRLSTSADKACINLDYIPHLRNSLTLPLMDEANAKEGVSGIIKLLQTYDLTREDWDSIMEVGQFEGHRDPMTKIPSKVKGAFTRAYNKDHHKTPYILKSAPAKSRGKNYDTESQGDDNQANEDDEEESLENSAMLVKAKKPASKAKNSKNQESKGKGKGPKS